MTVSERLRKAVGEAAPALATALGGPAGGMVAREMSERILGRPDAALEVLEQRLAESYPEDQAALRQIEADLVVQSARIAADDRANARARQAEEDDVTPKWLAWAIFAMLATSITALLFIEPPVASRDILYILLGGLMAKADQVTSFFFGSSSGSKTKTSLMAKEGR